MKSLATTKIIKCVVSNPDNLLSTLNNILDFLEDEFLNKNVKVIEECGKHITNLKQVGKGIGEYMFDKHNF